MHSAFRRATRALSYPAQGVPLTADVLSVQTRHKVEVPRLDQLCAHCSGTSPLAERIVSAAPRLSSLRRGHLEPLPSKSLRY